MELICFQPISQPKGKTGKVRTGDIVLLQEDRPHRHMWEKIRVVELKVGRDGDTRTVVLRGANGNVLVCLFQLGIHVEVEQGGEDVEDP